MDCLFCAIARGEIPSTKVFEDDSVFAFRDIAPQAPVHVLVIPKQHIGSLHEINSDNEHILSHMFSVTRDIAVKEGISETGYRVISNVGNDAGQSVKHLHLHLLGGKQMKWDN